MYLPTLPAMTDFFRTSSSMVQMGLTTSMIGLGRRAAALRPLERQVRTPHAAADGHVALHRLHAALHRRLGHPPVHRRTLPARHRRFGRHRHFAVGGHRPFRRPRPGPDAGAQSAPSTASQPVVAPIIGGTLTDSIGWQGIFCILLGLGCLLLAGCFRLRESLPAERRSAVAWNDILRNFGTVLRNRRYLAYVLQMGFAQGVLFAYIASSPFIVQGHYGFSAFEFSICFAVNAVAIGGAAAFSIRFRSPEQSTRTGCARMLLFAAAEAAALGLGCGFWVYEGVLFGLLFVMGLTFTSPTALAMESAPRGTPARPRPCWAPSASRSAASYRRWSASATRFSHRCGLRRAAPCSWLSLRIAPAAHDARRRS